MKEFKRIKEWVIDDRPREKLLQRGQDALTNAELLAILINTGTTNKSALDIAKDILALSHQNLLEMGKLTLQDIQSIKGMGEKKALTLIAALELGKRRQLATRAERHVIRNAKDAFESISPYFIDKSQEQFFTIYLNQAKQIISIDTISSGGLTSTVVDPRIIFKKALQLAGVTNFIIAHNHPSGNCFPSEADKMLTKRLKEAGSLLDIKLIDHLIIGANDFYSFADNHL